MKSLDNIRKDLISGNYVHSIHSAARVIERNISAREIAQIGKNAIIIEDYPDDKNLSKLSDTGLYRRREAAAYFAYKR